MGEFTPGPWRFSNGELARVFAGGLVICGVHKLGKLGGLTIGDPIANGALIAAAPDMFEALKPFARLADIPDGGQMKFSMNDMRRAAAALAKAQGVCIANTIPTETP